MVNRLSCSRFPVPALCLPQRKLHWPLLPQHRLPCCRVHMLRTLSQAGQPAEASRKWSQLSVNSIPMCMHPRNRSRGCKELLTGCMAARTGGVRSKSLSVSSVAAQNALAGNCLWLSNSMTNIWGQQVLHPHVDCKVFGLQATAQACYRRYRCTQCSTIAFMDDFPQVKHFS